MKKTEEVNSCDQHSDEEMEVLKKEYAEAQKDGERQETINDWKILDGEGWDE